MKVTEPRTVGCCASGCVIMIGVGTIGPVIIWMSTHPWRSVAIGAGVGLVLGALARRYRRYREEENEREWAARKRRV